jgi:hypothetical protein
VTRDDDVRATLRSQTISVRLTAEEKKLLVAHAARIWGANGEQMTPGQAARALALYAAELIGRVVLDATVTLTLADLSRLVEMCKWVGINQFRSGILASLAGAWAAAQTPTGLADPVLDRFVARIQALPPTHATQLAYTVGLLMGGGWSPTDGAHLADLQVHGIAPTASSWPATVSTWPNRRSWWQADERHSRDRVTFGADWVTPGTSYAVEWVGATGEIVAFQADGEQVHVLGGTRPHGLDWGGDHRGEATTDRVALTLSAYERHRRTVGTIYELARDLTVLLVPSGRDRCAAPGAVPTARSQP